jgi:hypothetical protein
MRIAPVLLVVLVGCSDSMSSSDALHASIGDALQEDRAYQVHANAMTTMPAMLGEVDRHESRLTVIVGDMGVQMGSMMMECTGVGGMMDVRDGMMSELDAHVATMRTGSTPGDARAEVERHVDAMRNMLDEMRTMLDVSQCRGM